MNDQPVSDDGRMWAVASYAGLLLFLPIGIIPLVQRNDAFALHHAKIATAVWVGSVAASLIALLATICIAFLTCGVGAVLTAPVMMVLGLWPIITGIHGLVLTINSDWRAPLGSFELADRMFASVNLQDDEL